MAAPGSTRRTEEQRFLREAIELAVRSVREGGGPFGAIVVRDGRVVGRGTNRVTATNDPTAHAEIVAIRAACERLGSFQLDGCDVYASSEPCPMCLGALYWARPARVRFASSRATAAAAGFDDRFIYDEISRPILERALEMRRMPVEGAGEEFDAWLARDDRVEY